VNDFPREPESVAPARWQSLADAGAARGGRVDAAGVNPSEAVQHVCDLLANLRLLEAAGACGAMARTVTDDDANEPPEWWEALGTCARTYRSAIFSASAQGFSAIDEWSRSEGSANHHDLIRERTRLGAEYRRWWCEIPGGQAYVAWLSAYVAVAEIDGERAVSGLERCSAIVREFIDVPGLGRELSVYDFLQSAANALTAFLPLPEHPVRDLRRFALVPLSLKTGYGS
jgi:hypothetical protein